MLGKLLKYEFRATARVMLPVLAGLLLTALAARFAITRLYDWYRPVMIIGTFVVVAYFLAILAAGALTLVTLVYRFYRSLLSDEGYLSFSLPVGVHAQLWCKLITSAVWIAAAFAAVLLSVALVASPASLTGSVLSGLAGVAERLKLGWSIGAADLLAFALELLLLSLLAAMGGCLVFYASLSLGCGFADRKALWSVLIYLGISLGSNLLLGLAAGALGLGFSGGHMTISAGLVETLGLEPDYAGLWHLYMLGSCAVQAAYCAALYCVTAWALKKRLNLA